jgi:hypothetical protein
MAYVYNTVYTIDTFPSFSTFLPCCNAPISVDYQSRHFQEVYYAPEPPAQIQVVRQRLPDPPPDVIDRVLVVPQPKQYIYQVVEVPTKPPPVVRERVVHQSPNSPLCGGTYRVQVPPKSNTQSSRLIQSSSNIQPTPTYVQASPSYVQASPSYVQASPSYMQASPSYVQQAPIMITSPQVISI